MRKKKTSPLAKRLSYYFVSPLALALSVSLSVDDSVSEPRSSTPLLSATIAVDAVAENSPSPQASAPDAFEQAENDLKAREQALLAQLAESSSSEIIEEDVKQHETIVYAPTQQVSVSEAEAPSRAMLNIEELKNHPALNGAKKEPRRSGRLASRASYDENDLSRSSSAPAQKLAIAESQVAILTQELDTTRRSLRSAENRIEELSSLVRDSYRPKTGGTVRRNHLDPTLHDPLLLQDVDAKSHLVPIYSEESIAGDSSPGTRGSEVATIAADRTALRIGPGRLESALMTMPRNTQVTVERRTGDWFRVLTPAGTRGWVHGPVLIFAAGIPTSSAVRIKAARIGNEPTGLRY